MCRYRENGPVLRLENTGVTTIAVGLRRRGLTRAISCCFVPTSLFGGGEGLGRRRQLFLVRRPEPLVTLTSGAASVLHSTALPLYGYTQVRGPRTIELATVTTNCTTCTRCGGGGLASYRDDNDDNNDSNNNNRNSSYNYDYIRRRHRRPAFWLRNRTGVGARCEPPVGGWPRGNGVRDRRAE